MIRVPEPASGSVPPASATAVAASAWEERINLVGGAFFGESMFSVETDCSKLALYWLCQQLKAWSFELIDCQIASQHLRTLGATEIPRDRFLSRLRASVQHPSRTGSWRYEIAVPSDPQHRSGVVEA